MTDTAVASMPSREQRCHLTAWQRRVLQTLIVVRLQTYSDRAAQAAAALDDYTSGDSPHEREIARDTLKSLLDGMVGHEDALRRLDSGTYGTCHICVRPIPFERLEAIPEVTHCVGCTR